MYRSAVLLVAFFLFGATNIAAAQAPDPFLAAIRAMKRSVAPVDSRGRVLGMLLVAGGGPASGISHASTSDAILAFLSAHPAAAR